MLLKGFIYASILSVILRVEEPPRTHSRGTNSVKIDQTSWKTLDPIDLPAVKKKGSRSSAATLVDKNRTRLYKHQSSPGFYGAYTIIFEKSNYAGDLVIYNREKNAPWKYDNPNDVFVEMLIVSDEIEIFGKMRVGLSKAEFLDFFGPAYFEKDQVTIFKGNEGLYVSIFWKDNAAEKIRVGKYCSDSCAESLIIDYLLSHYRS